MTNANPQLLNGLMASLREADRDRYLTALFAPPDRRAALMALYLYDIELARIADRTNEPMAAMIRHQWWRDGLNSVAETGDSAQPVLAGLAPAIQSGEVDIDALQAINDVREDHIDGLAFDDPDKVVRFAEQTGGAIQAAAAALLGAADAPVIAMAHNLGTARALTRYCHAIRLEGGAPAAALIDALLAKADALLARGRVPKQTVAAFLPAIAVRRDLANLARGAAPELPPWHPIKLYWASIWAQN